MKGNNRTAKLATRTPVAQQLRRASHDLTSGAAHYSLTRRSEDNTYQWRTSPNSKEQGQELLAFKAELGLQSSML